MMKQVLLSAYIIYARALKKSANEFYHFVATLLLEQSLTSIANAKIYIDGTMDRNLRTHLRQALNSEKHLIHSIDLTGYNSPFSDANLPS